MFNWFTTILHCQTLCSHLCKLCQADLQHQTFLSQSAAKKQLGIDCEDLRTKYKSEHLPSHDLHIDQVVMYQDSTSKCWFPATITRLCKEPRNYIITTIDGVQYRKNTSSLGKTYQPQDKKSADKQLLQNNHMQTVKSLKSQNFDNLTQSRPKRDIKPPIKLDL